MRALALKAAARCHSWQDFADVLATGHAKPGFFRRIGAGLKIIRSGFVAGGKLAVSPGARVQTNTVTVPPKTGGDSASLVFLGDLSIEPKKFNEQMYFDKSLQRLQKDGYERHLRPAEAFLVMTAQRGSALHKNMLLGYGEWMSVALRHDGDKLFVWFEPDLFWGGEKYVGDTSSFQTFSVGKATRWVKFTELPSELVVALVGSAMDTIPKNAKLFLPEKPGWWPVMRGGIGNYEFEFDTDDHQVRAASRGIGVPSKKDEERRTNQLLGGGGSGGGGMGVAVE